MTYSETINTSVKANGKGYELGGASRWGTVRCTLYQFAELFGQCHDQGDEFKVTERWFFETPRGRASVRDYHLNRSDELSICSIDPRAALWIVAHIRRLKVKAYMGVR